MLYCVYIVKDRVSKLKRIKETMKPNVDINDYKSKAYTMFYDIALGIQEYSIVNGQYFDLSFLKQKVKELRESKDYESYINVITAMINRYEPLGEETSECISNSNFYSYNIGQQISEDFIKTMLLHIKSNRKLNVFDTNCFYGQIMQLFDPEKFNVYGLNTFNSNLSEPKKYAIKVIKNNLRGSRISNNAFDVLIGYAPYEKALSKNTIGGSIVLQEKQYLQGLYKFLNKEGLLIFAIPYFRLHKNICISIAKNLKNVKVIKAVGKNLDKRYVYIIGQKADDNKNIDENIYTMLRKAYDYDSIHTIYNETFEDYKFSNIEVPIELFKGSVLDEEELHDIIKNSSCFNSFIEKQKVDKIQDNVKKPLLPFNIGQIGLVLTSGCLDGVIDEGNNFYHVVKGKVSKKSDKDRQIVDGVIEEREVISNKVEINILLPNGDFKTLT